MPIERIIIKRSDLLEKAEGNLADYKELVEAAEEAYKEVFNIKKEKILPELKIVGYECVEKLASCFKDSDWKKGLNYYGWSKDIDRKVDEFESFCQKEKPSNHVEEFEDAVGMLRLSCEEEISLSKNEYLQLCENRWDFVESLVNRCSTFVTRHYGNVGIGTTSASSKLNVALSKFSK